MNCRGAILTLEMVEEALGWEGMPPGQLIKDVQKVLGWLRDEYDKEEE